MWVMAMKKVSSFLEKFNALKYNFQNHQILISIIGFILFVILGTNMYSTYLEHYIAGYRNNFRNKLWLKLRPDRYFNDQL